MSKIVFLVRAALIGCWIVLTASSAIAQSVEIIPLQHRSAEELILQLKPFLDAGGTVSGMNSTLILKTSAKNQAEIKKLIAALDSPRRRLMISVRQENSSTMDDQGAAVAGSVIIGGSDPSIAGRTKIYSSDRNVKRDTVQQVQTLDGGRASIHVGQSFLVPLRQLTLTPAGAVVSETFVQRDLGTGFVASPKLMGDRVSLEISPTDETREPGTTVGASNVQRLVTTVAGRLGEWIVLGSSADVSSTKETGITRYGTRSGAGKRTVLLKVDELP